MQMKTISAKRLEMAGACKDQVSLFRSELGDKLVRLTQENWDRAQEIGLDRLWMYRFLGDAALAEYHKTCDAALAEYRKTRDAALAEYHKACDAVLAEYHKACVAALAEYHKTCEAAGAEYRKACAAALFAALTK